MLIDNDQNYVITYNFTTMTTIFKKISTEEIRDNTFKIIGKDDFLITAGTKDHFNTMTAGWGGLGFIWYKPVSYCFIRPQRYTFQFMEKQEYYTLCFFDETYRKILDFCGNVSGKDIDKMKETGLKQLETELGNIYYEQARLVMECRKLYAQFLDEKSFVDLTILPKVYPTKDFHRLYIGEIVNCLLKE